MHYNKCITQIVLCKAENKIYFDEPLRHEDTKGYGIFNPQIAQISQIFANFRFGVFGTASRHDRDFKRRRITQSARISSANSGETSTPGGISQIISIFALGNLSRHGRHGRQGG
jgi:hypothetical protein